ncbi:hypothetical protein QVD17_13108 [Tagetes erecta]|uniref:Plus3 domain-containing protein n=1 Tax=Tagetes erecta TaxID=13708 RepID=A0AAD8L0B2_TARER|nr:hypothetical protein QVD17_13108 [Tagetes erecta]
MDMNNFVGFDTLAELVWSPQTGVNVKFTVKKPCFKAEDLDSQYEEHIASLATPRASHEGVKSINCKGSQNQKAKDTLFKQLFENKMTRNVNDSGSKMETDDYCSKPFLENTQVAIFEDQNDDTRDTKSQLILGSKRFKKKDDEYATKTDHSFMKWISNILQGLKNRNIYDQKIRMSNETRSLDSKETGFQNVFQSLFSPETIARIENRSISSSVLAKRRSTKSLGHIDTKNKNATSLVKQLSLYEKVSKETPKGMFDAIRKLRLSRTDIHKDRAPGRSPALPHPRAGLVRLRVAKREEGVEGSRYYVGCITGLQRETLRKDLKRPIRVKVGRVECFVESQHVSNCDFKEEEVIAWWKKTSKNQRVQVFKDLKSKLAVRRTLGM